MSQQVASRSSKPAALMGAGSYTEDAAHARIDGGIGAGLWPTLFGQDELVWLVESFVSLEYQNGGACELTSVCSHDSNIHPWADWLLQTTRCTGYLVEHTAKLWRLVMGLVYNN